MSLDIDHFRKYVIRPTLNHLGLYSENAEELLLATAIQESRLTYLKQLGNGPAVSVFQIEMATHNDIFDNYLVFKEEIFRKVIDLRSKVMDDRDEMMNNLAYATAIARIHYLRVPHPLPNRNDVSAMARYWKQYYNTPKGRGTEKEFISAYEKYIRK